MTSKPNSDVKQRCKDGDSLFTNFDRFNGENCYDEPAKSCNNSFKQMRSQ
ncbi:MULTISPECIES: hypothetical protein [Chroococcidiopsis]|nr:MULTISPECIES: hypothetical protein [Chroococcidiopsis]URD49137.1 hypothetical protein M5J74_22775 [Chroococcidiopsis sp. CCNUC1]